MQADRIRGDAGCGSGMVCVSRDGEGDSRKVLVPVAELRRPHFHAETGGRGVALPPGSLAAFMFCDLIPAGVPFGHGHVHCVRRGRPSSIRVVDRSGEHERGGVRLAARDGAAPRRRRGIVMATEPNGGSPDPGAAPSDRPWWEPRLDWETYTVFDSARDWAAEHAAANDPSTSEHIASMSDATIVHVVDAWFEGGWQAYRDAFMERRAQVDVEEPKSVPRRVFGALMWLPIGVVAYVYAIFVVLPIVVVVALVLGAF
jgi:hypothetical protein